MPFSFGGCCWPCCCVTAGGAGVATGGAAGGGFGGFAGGGTEPESLGIATGLRHGVRGRYRQRGRYLCTGLLKEFVT